ncbi:MAG: hypothetical protein MZV70_34935 [Desulfobacterales bacterium]|nr:hypothetical protein [Desulfobacterales bacterium]
MDPSSEAGFLFFGGAAFRGPTVFAATLPAVGRAVFVSAATGAGARSSASILSCILAIVSGHLLHLGAEFPGIGPFQFAHPPA